MVEPSMTTRVRSSSRRESSWQRVETAALTAIALFALPVALHASILPKSFFSDFPFGRGWIAVGGGAYDEHLVRDVGALFLALTIVTVWAIWRRDAARPVAVAWLVQGLFHLGFHLAHLYDLRTFDRIGIVMSLAAVPILAAVVLIADSKTPRARRALPSLPTT